VPDLTEEQHAQAGLALLYAAPGLGPTRVFEGKVPDPMPDPPYVVVYIQVDWTLDGIATALDATQVTVTTMFNCHCVGLTAAAARATAMLVRSALLNVRPVIAGRNCGPIKHGDTFPPQRDESTGRPVMDVITEYWFHSAG
jgi:hypothetical protein